MTNHETLLRLIRERYAQCTVYSDLARGRQQISRSGNISTYNYSFTSLFVRDRGTMFSFLGMGEGSIPANCVMLGNSNDQIAPFLIGTGDCFWKDKSFKSAIARTSGVSRGVSKIILPLLVDDAGTSIIDDLCNVNVSEEVYRGKVCLQIKGQLGNEVVTAKVDPSNHILHYLSSVANNGAANSEIQETWFECVVAKDNTGQGQLGSSMFAIDAG